MNAGCLNHQQSGIPSANFHGVRLDHVFSRIFIYPSGHGNPLYYSHTSPIRNCKDMGIVWEAYQKGVLLLGVCGNHLDVNRITSPKTDHAWTAPRLWKEQPYATAMFVARKVFPRNRHFFWKHGPKGSQWMERLGSWWFCWHSQLRHAALMVGKAEVVMHTWTFVEWGWAKLKQQVLDIDISHFFKEGNSANFLLSRR